MDSVTYTTAELVAASGINYNTLRKRFLAREIFPLGRGVWPGEAMAVAKEPLQQRGRPTKAEKAKAEKKLREAEYVPISAAAWTLQITRTLALQRLLTRVKRGLVRHLFQGGQYHVHRDDVAYLMKPLRDPKAPKCEPEAVLPDPTALDRACLRYEAVRIANRKEAEKVEAEVIRLLVSNWHEPGEVYRCLHTGVGYSHFNGDLFRHVRY